MKTRIAALLVLAAALTASACTNPKIPEGHEGYIHHIPLVFGKKEYRDTLAGPASTGVAWRLFTINIDMRVKTYNEDFELLTRDNLTVSFQANARIQLRPGSSREVVERWGGENWYKWNLQEPLRTVVRETVTRYSATDIQLKTPEVGAHIEQVLKERYDDTPFDIISVAIGQIQFPKAVTDAIEAKIAKEEELRRQEIILAKAKKEAAIHVLEALRQAKQQQIISETLDPLYLQSFAISTYRELAGSGNKAVIVLPNTPQGTGMPLVHSQGRRRVLTPDDEALLRQMEEHYMEIASELDIDEDFERLETDLPALPAPGLEPDAPGEPEPGEPEPTEDGAEE